jgi:hypothetical protein
MEALLSGENTFNLDHQGELFFALWLSWSGSTEISVRVELTSSPVRQKDKAIAIGLSVLGLCLLSIAIILAIEWWRRRRVGTVHLERLINN